MRLGLAALIAISLGCGTRDRTCDPAVDFIYRDARCGILPNGPGPCTEVGDGLCHLRCDSDGDCPSSAPKCHVLGLFQGGDFSCNASVRVCGHAERDECPISR
jgi:hypothetical protein